MNRIKARENLFLYHIYDFRANHKQSTFRTNRTKISVEKRVAEPTFPKVFHGTQ